MHKWTDRDTEQLKELCKDGAPKVSVLAERMGVPRGTIYYQLHRLGIVAVGARPGRPAGACNKNLSANLRGIVHRWMLREVKISLDRNPDKVVFESDGITLIVEPDVISRAVGMYTRGVLKDD